MLKQRRDMLLYLHYWDNINISSMNGNVTIGALLTVDGRGYLMQLYLHIHGPYSTNSEKAIWHLLFENTTI